MNPGSQMFKISRVLGDYKVLSYLPECLESFRGMNTNVKIMRPIFSPGRFTSLCIHLGPPRIHVSRVRKLGTLVSPSLVTQMVRPLR